MKYIKRTINLTDLQNKKELCDCYNYGPASTQHLVDVEVHGKETKKLKDSHGEVDNI